MVVVRSLVSFFVSAFALLLRVQSSIAAPYLHQHMFTFSCVQGDQEQEISCMESSRRNSAPKVIIIKLPVEINLPRIEEEGRLIQLSIWSKAPLSRQETLEKTPLIGNHISAIWGRNPDTKNDILTWNTQFNIQGLQSILFYTLDFGNGNKLKWLPKPSVSFWSKTETSQFSTSFVCARLTNNSKVLDCQEKQDPFPKRSLPPAIRFLSQFEHAEFKENASYEILANISSIQGRMATWLLVMTMLEDTKHRVQIEGLTPQPHQAISPLRQKVARTLQAQLIKVRMEQMFRHMLAAQL